MEYDTCACGLQSADFVSLPPRGGIVGIIVDNLKGSDVSL